MQAMCYLAQVDGGYTTTLIAVEGKENPDAAWYYPKTKALANEIEGYVAFWKGVEVIK